MNAGASEALYQAVSTEDPGERRKAVELWVTRWVVTADTRVAISDPHPRVVALELASATRQMVETVALTGAAERVLQVTPPQFDPRVLSYAIEMTCLRYSVPARPGMLGVVAGGKRRAAKRRT